MLPVWVRLMLLGAACLARVLCDVLFLGEMLPRVLAEGPSSALLLAPLLLVPLLRLTGPYLPPAGLLGVAALGLPVALLVPLSPLPAVLLVGLASIVFLATAFAQLANLCQVHRYPLPRIVGVLGAVTLALLVAARATSPVSPGLILTLAGMALVLGLPVAWDRPVVGSSWLVPAWGFLLGLLAFLALTAGTLANLAADLATPVLVGCSVGCLLAAGQGNLWRCPGLVPIAGLGLCLALLLIFLLGAESSLLCGFLGLTQGLGFVPLLAAYLGATSAPARPLAIALLAGLGLPIAVGAFSLAPGFGVLVPLALLFTLVATIRLVSQLFEQLLEIFGAVLCHIRVTGPGARAIPTEGPLVLVANHSAYFDPVWLCKMMPRKVTAMMTSVFYDLPIVRWLMVHVTHAIRVPAATVRREAPELQEAIGVLQAGGCLLVFPEARLRKSEERLLFPFGQGLWHILKAVPEAQVVTVWVEGGWGSWTSHANGQPPFRGKPIDCLRKITLGVAAPESVSAEHLADREAFRQWLMTCVLGCRAYVGLSVPTIEQATGREPSGQSENPHPIDSESDGNR